MLCSALVDRLCHKSYLVNMTGTSYRIKETKIINQQTQPTPKKQKIEPNDSKNDKNQQINFEV